MVISEHWLCPCALSGGWIDSAASGTRLPDSYPGADQGTQSGAPCCQAAARQHRRSVAVSGTHRPIRVHPRHAHGQVVAGERDAECGSTRIVVLCRGQYSRHHTFARQVAVGENETGRRGVVSGVGEELDDGRLGRSACQEDAGHIDVGGDDCRGYDRRQPATGPSLTQVQASGIA